MTTPPKRQTGIAIAVVGCLVLIPIALVLGVIIGALLPANASAAPDSLSGWVTTCATVVICILTIVLAVETWRLRAAQAAQLRELRLDSIRPNVSVELHRSQVGLSFMNVRVANSGKGIARKIQFEFMDRDGQALPIQSNSILAVFHKLAMFRLGIESLGINQELKSFLFSFLDLPREIGAGPFTPYVNIRICFEDTEGNKYMNAFVIDFAQYEGFSEIGGNPLNDLADEVKGIREQLRKFGTGFDRMAVDVYNSNDRETMRKLNQRRRRESIMRSHREPDYAGQ